MPGKNDQAKTKVGGKAGGKAGDKKEKKPVEKKEKAIKGKK
jgi:hypothetical protein